jgi:hypothetical protein
MAIAPSQPPLTSRRPQPGVENKVVPCVSSDLRRTRGSSKSWQIASILSGGPTIFTVSGLPAGLYRSLYRSCGNPCQALVRPHSIVRHPLPCCALPIDGHHGADNEPRSTLRGRTIHLPYDSSLVTPGLRTMLASEAKG